MRKTTLTLLFLLFALLSFADSRITKTYIQRPLPEVLIDIADAAPEIDIRFIYNRLEDYTVTCTIQNAGPLEAIRQAVGFYPIKVSQKGATLIVESQFETDRKLIGRVVDERGEPLEFANVTLFSTADNSLITGGVTNAGGDFVIPCEQTTLIVRVSYVGYETLIKPFDFLTSAISMDVGILSLRVDPKVLSEVKVVGDLATTSAEKSTYFPSSRHKNAAIDAVSLLHHMMIPQLRLNPLTGYVTTLSGETVAIFTDYLPATAEDLAGMNTQDVKRVEIYDFPKDVRFQGKPHVINFVMQKYELGGYTKLTTSDRLLSDFSSNNSVYSKLTYKNWTFDANVSAGIFNQNHIGVQGTETYNLPAQTIYRTETYTDGKQRIRQTSASLRATYNTEKLQLANRLEFLDDNTPRQELLGSVSYSPAIFNSTISESRRKTHNLSPKYSGDWYFELPKDWSLSVSPEFLYSHNRQSRFYKETTVIENEINEDLTEFDWFLDLSKSFGRHSLSFTHFGMNYNSQLDYKGSTVSNHSIRDLALCQGASYSYSAEKFNVSANFSYNYLLSKVGDETERLWHPSVGLSGQYSPNRRNSLSLSFNYLSSAPTDPQRNPSLMQENEMMFYCGNPSLKNYGNYIGKIQYNWMPSNKLTASAYVRHVYVSNYIANVYELHNNGGAVIRRIENAGDSHSTYIGTSLTLRLLNEKLQFSADPRLNILRFSGHYNVKDAPFMLDLRANYYLGQFYFMAGYTTPKKSYLSGNATWKRDRSFYYLTAGWGNAKWKVRLDLCNLFRGDWRGSRTEISTSFYAMDRTTFNASSHQRINLTLSYTFNYGKNVKPGNELKEARGGQSSIL